MFYHWLDINKKMNKFIIKNVKVDGNKGYILIDGFAVYRKLQKYLVDICDCLISKQLSFKTDDSEVKKYYDTNYDRIFVFLIF